jgi:hypothetical protein
MAQGVMAAGGWAATILFPPPALGERRHRSLARRLTAVRQRARCHIQADPLLSPVIPKINESSEYDWKPFKKQAEQGIRALLRSYPYSNLM